LSFYAKSIVTKIEGGEEDFTSSLVNKLYNDVKNRLESKMPVDSGNKNPEVNTFAVRPKRKATRKSKYKKSTLTQQNTTQINRIE